MRERAAAFIAGAAWLLCFASGSRRASAEEEASPEPARSIAIEATPLALLMPRLGVDVQLLAAPHHAFLFNAHGDYWGEPHSENYRGVGGEIGYRTYTGKRGLSGAFIGPSLLLGTYWTHRYSDETTRHAAVGLALDVGLHTVTRGGLAFGVGLGVQLLYLSHFGAIENTDRLWQVAGSGVRPRVVLELGYAP